MRPEIAKRLALAFPGLSIPTTGVIDVAEVARYARKPQQLRQLRPLRLEIEERGKCDDEGAAGLDDAGPDVVAIDERAGLASGRIPAVYLDVWARLNCQKPARVSDAEWRLALADGRQFFNAWGDDIAALEWTPGALFDVASGLIWQLHGERVEALGADNVRLSDGRILQWQ